MLGGFFPYPAPICFWLPNQPIDLSDYQFANSHLYFFCKKVLQIKNTRLFLHPQLRDIPNVVGKFLFSSVG